MISRKRIFAISFWIYLAFLSACSQTAAYQPKAIFYLKGLYEERQVWRLALDGSSNEQIPHESAGVESYSVSSGDSSLAFVSANQLFLVDADGENRLLIADGTIIDENIQDYVFHGFVSNPVFSPDGRTLAYDFDGLHLYDISSGEDDHVLTNLGNLLDEPFVFAKEVYSPAAWSPDGSMLLFSMSYYEGSTLAIMEPGESQPFRRLRSSGAVCCHYNWTMDNRAVLVGNPNFTTNPPGLWRFDTESGEEVEIFGLKPGDPFLSYVGWPFQLTSTSDLVFFNANMDHFSPEEGIQLKMVRSRADGSEITAIREEDFAPRQVLWAGDGSFAVILGRYNDGEGQIILAKTDGSPLEVLLTNARNVTSLSWGP